MDDIKRRVKDFLKRNKMDYESIDIKRVSDLSGRYAEGAGREAGLPGNAAYLYSNE